MTSFDADISLPIVPDGAFSIDAVLNCFTHFGVELGLERIRRLLAALGNPQRQVPVLHVAGSNGKGSVCAYLAAVLHQAGYRVGRYTSPHLVSWCERIWIDGADIPPQALYDVLQEVVAAIAPDQPSPTQFEVITAAAWLHFARQQVDVAVIEVGLGGRLDATNVCDRPLVSMITSLSREHWQRLGPTLADIAREKAGILKPGCPVAIAPQPPEAEAVLKQRIAELDCPAVWVSPALDIGEGWAMYQGWEPQKQSLSAMRQAVSLQYALPLLGAHQLTNSAVAIAALHLLRAQGWNIADEAIATGIANTQWRGRLQWLNWKGHSLLVDGAHNPAGAATLRHYIDTYIDQSVYKIDDQSVYKSVYKIDDQSINKTDKNTHKNISQPLSQTSATSTDNDVSRASSARWDNSFHSNPGKQVTPQKNVGASGLSITWVMGMIANKDHADVFRALLRAGDRLYLAPVPDHLSADLEELASLAADVCPELESCCLTTDVISALHLAFQVPDQPAATVLCGSLYLIGHFFSSATAPGNANVK